MKDFLKTLNTEQYEAATTKDGYLLCYAGAGCGKTAMLVARTAYIVDSGKNPKNILLLTFTNKAAKEMKSRISNQIGELAEDITATTFHSFCAAFLRENAHYLGIPADYSVIDSSDMLDAITIAKEEFLDKQKEKGIEYNLKEFPTKNIIGKVYECSVNNCISLDKALLELKIKYDTEVKRILEIFKKYKKDRNFLDYNDLLYFTYFLLKNNDTLRYQTSNKYHYISCDEYQDTNTIQDKILDYLSEVHKNLAVVGDDNQSIYAFRYANIQNILTFADRHPGTKTIVLKTNYRSCQSILNVSNEMMKYATEGMKKDLVGVYDGEKPKLVIPRNEYEEARYIIEGIKNSSSPYQNIAVICRSANLSYVLENMLNTEGIPYNKFGGLKFTEKVAIKDILAFLRFSVNEKDELATFRAIQLYPGIGKKYASTISSLIATDGMSKTIEKYKKKGFYKYLIEFQKTINDIKPLAFNQQMDYLYEYYENIRERTIETSKESPSKKSEAYAKLKEDMKDITTLKSMSDKYFDAISFLSDLVLDATVEEDTDGKINITTIHSAKGLEYDVVFVMDCIEEITPRCPEGSYEDPEELRCVYVALTRAKYELYLMCPQFHSIKYITGKLSHFLNKESVTKTLDKIYY